MTGFLYFREGGALDGCFYSILMESVARVWGVRAAVFVKFNWYCADGCGESEKILRWKCMF